MKYGVEATLERMTEEPKLAGYSRTTVNSYRGAAGRFLRHIGKASNRLTQDDVRRYLLYLTEAKYSASTINQHHFAIRFLYRDVLKKKAFRMEQRLHKRPKRVPIVLAREEIDALFRATSDLQERTIWMTLYSTGVRLSEALRLQVSASTAKTCGFRNIPPSNARIYAGWHTYGLFANRHRAANLELCRELLGVASETVPEPEAETAANDESSELESWEERMLRLTGIDPTVCPA